MLVEKTNLYRNLQRAFAGEPSTASRNFVPTASLESLGRLRSNRLQAKDREIELPFVGRLSCPSSQAIGELVPCQKVAP
jgi:hypothetical protein